MNKRARLNYIHAMSTQVEHKKMYKAKKQWVVAGLSFLVATGLGVVGGQLTTHADTTNVSQQATTSVAPKVASGSSNNVSQNSSASTSSVKPSVAPSSNIKPSVSSNDIQHRAEMLYTQVVNKGMNALHNIKNTPINDSGSSAVNNSASAKSSVSSSSNNVSSEMAYLNSLSNAEYSTEVASLKGSNASNKAIKKVANNKLSTTNHIHTGNANGLNYKYASDTKTMEFTNGTLNWNGGSFFQWGQSPYLKYTKHIKFDDKISLGNTTNLKQFFNGNSNILSIDLGKGFNTSKVTNMNGMFGEDPNLQLLNLPSTFNGPKVITTEGMFASDYKLTSLDLSKFNTTSALTDTIWMFHSDSSLQSLKLSNKFDVSEVTSMYSMFVNDYKLKSLDLSMFNTTSALTNTMQMVNGDTSLQSLKLSNKFNTSNVTNMNGMFGVNPNLQSINLPSTFNGPKVTTTEGMFADDYKLKSLDLSMFNTTSALTNTMQMVNGDTSLQSLKLSNKFNTSNVTNMNNMFTGVGFQKININSNNTKFNSSTDLGTMYKQLPNNKYSDKANDFSKGNLGTFVAGYIARPINNPNSVMTKNNSNLTNNQWNQNFHFNNPQGQNNDIESIIPHKDSNGNIEYWDVYYLWNPDPGNQGPNAYDEWGQVKASKDFKQFYPVDTNNPVSLNNVAIPNPAYEINGQNRIEVANTTPYDVSFPWRQVAGGSIISNKKANGGQWLTKDQITGNSISPNARLAYFANYGNNTDSYLAYANPNGKGGYQQFRPYSEQNVFTANQVGAQYGDFRDPYVTTNPKNPNQLVAYCAGGHNRKIYVLTSNDAINWTASTPIDVSNLLQNTLHDSNGSAETPYVSEINNTPIMFMSEQGSDHRNEGIAYITGTFNNNGIFTTTPNSKQGTVDLGHDVYAGNFAKLNENQLVFIGWSNSWGYFNGTHVGGFTLPRIINWNNQTNQLESTPVDPAQSSLSDKDDNGNYEVNGKVIISSNNPTNNFNITFTRANDNNNHVNFTFNNGKLTVSRNGSANGVTNMNNTVNLGKSKLSSVQFYLDNDTLAAYFPDTKQMYSVLDYDNTRNTPYKLTGVPSNTNLASYQFEDSAAPKKVNNTVAFTDSKTNDLVGSTTVNGALNSNYTINQAPNGYSFIDNDNKITIVNPSQKVNVKVAKDSNTTNSANQDVPVAANTDTDTIDYQYKGVTKGSQQFSGNDQNATDAGSNSIDVNSKVATKMPTGYQLANADNNIPYDNGTHNVAITPIQQTDTIDYMDGSQKVASDNVSGNDSSAQGASDTTFDANSQMPNGYKLAKNQPSGLNPNKINYDGSSHTVNVVVNATNQTANVHYKLPNGQIINGTISGKNGSDATPTAPQGYHFNGTPKKYHFSPENAGNEPSDDITVAPNTYSGTATVHIKYNLGNGDIVNGSDQHVNVSGQYGQSDMIVNSTQYCPMNDAYQDKNSDWLINFNNLTKNGNVSNDKSLQHTFTYDATEAPNLVIRYDLINQSNDKPVKKDIHDDTFTASQLGIKPQDWVIGNTITIGTKKNDDTNKLDVINAPVGYHLVDNATGYDYQNAQESIQLEPNAQVSGHPVVLMTMPTGNVAPNSKSNKPAKPASNASGSASNAASISMNSSELSSLAKDIGGDINVTVRPNVTNTTNTIDDTTLNSLASEVATNNQEISSLANKPTSTANTTNVNYSYFDNLINNGVDKLTKAINQDFKASIKHAHAQSLKPRKISYLKWLRVVKPLKLYNANHEAVKVIKPRHRITLDVKVAYKVNNHIIFKVSYRNHNYFIRANDKATKNAYLPATKRLAGRKVGVLNNVYGYRHKNYDRVKTYHRGFVGRVKSIVKLGHYNMTRIQLTNGLWISANRNFIKLV